MPGKKPPFPVWDELVAQTCLPRSAVRGVKRRKTAGPEKRVCSTSPMPDPRKGQHPTRRGIILVERAAPLAQHEGYRRPFSQCDRKHGKAELPTDDKAGHGVPPAASPSAETSEAFQQPLVPVGPVDERLRACPAQCNPRSRRAPEPLGLPRLL